MLKIAHAAYVQTIRNHDRQYAEVKVVLEGMEHEEYLAYFKYNADHNTLELPFLTKNESSFEIDWFENSLHQAYQPEGWLEQARSELYAKLLAYGDIRSRVEAALSSPVVEAEQPAHLPIL
ncbi:hypothetical protein [Paenibacillus sp. y28]|uniref:hypothetical protein n=1 Tax=Paenibacillus sp. y28 TaxID=3129110 RepID=UPI003017D138